MALAPGTRLGPYEVLSLVGAGGMGEVYKARDSRLDRAIALKILPSQLASDAQFRERFDREARAISQLDHPHICALHDVGEQDGTAYLVMQYLEGETLADRIARGPLPLAEALLISRQIADALDAAHDRGIIHRDLKPSNVAITPEEVVKVLDFGLAKAEAGERVGFDISKSPTINAGGTRVGVILGTAAYMSPEQARGQPVDRRTDIWAFGCVLFEMLTGRGVFAVEGDSVTDALAAVLTANPDWSALPATTPRAVHRLLRRCLEKDLKRRLRDIGDARLELDDALAGDPTGRPADGKVAAARHVQFQRLTDFVGINESPSLSPDGKMVAFVALVAGRRQIWIQLLAGGTPLQITRDDADHEQPRWAPDSSALIYYSPSTTPGEQGTVWEISALGGTPRPIAPALGAGDMSHDGRRIALFQFENGRVDLVTAARDGSSMNYVRPVPTLVAYDCPRWSPDDRWLAFQGHVVTYFDQRIFVIPSAGGQGREVARGTILKGLSWLPDGAGIVYSSSAGSTLPYPPTFNLRTVDRQGTGDRQVTYGDASYVQPDVQRSGKLLACRIRSQSDIWRFPVTGSPAENTRDGVRITYQTGQVQTPSVSPDGREVAYLSDHGGHGNLWVETTDGRSVRQITFERDPDNALGVPVWSPAGKRIAFLITRFGESHLWLVNRDGTGLHRMAAQGLYACWSGDGQWLYYTPVRDRPWRIDKAHVDGGTPVRVRSDNAIAPATSADGSVLYYATQVEPEVGLQGDWEIRAARPEDGPSQTLARIVGSRIPVSPLLIHMFLSPNGTCLALPLIDGATCNLWALPTDGGDMRPLTEFGDRPIVIARRISWSPDGKSLYAAVAETKADIILLDGLLE